MPSDTYKRKLITILSADVVGYSRLMGDDEEATVQMLQFYRKIINSLISNQNGRLVDAPGDNMLAEFGSVVDALRCAWDIQQEIKSRNSDLPENRRMSFRIGINLGDVIEEDGSIYGDGVNVAARLESLAEAGGITISGTVYKHVKDKLPYRYKDQGKQSVKNIKEPVHVYRVLMESESIPTDSVEQEDEFKLPEGPSIAVLPFDNMSGDSEQEYICDGLTENIITSLSYNPKLFVIARNSSFYFKEKSVPVQEVAEKLHVHYVLEGSFQRAGDRVRINAQLIDAKTGHHLWAERYDRELIDIFDLQDEIAEKIFTALAVKLTDGESANIYSKYPMSFEARLKMMKTSSYMRRVNAESVILARQEVEEALSLSPEHPYPYTLMAWTYIWDLYFDLSKPSVNLLTLATRYSKSAIAIDRTCPEPYCVLSWVYLARGNYEKAIALAKRAITLNPNYDYAYYHLGITLIFADKPEKGLELIKKAVRINPIPWGMYFWHMGNAYRILGKYREAIAALKKAIDREPDDIFSRIYMAATYSLTGQEAKARAEVSEVLRIDSNFSCERSINNWPYKNQDEKERLISALRKAGLK